MNANPTSWKTVPTKRKTMKGTLIFPANTAATMEPIGLATANGSSRTPASNVVAPLTASNRKGSSITQTLKRIPTKNVSLLAFSLAA